MRVLYFSDKSSGHNRRFLDKLSSSGHEVWFLDSSSNDLPEDWLPSGVHFWRPKTVISSGIAPHEYRHFLPELQNCIEAIKPDLVHAGPIQTCAYLAALAGFHPLLAASWGSDILLHAERDADWRDSTVLALRRTDGFFCDCDAVRKAALKFVQIPASRIAQLPWGVEAGVFSPGTPEPTADIPSLGSGTVPFISTRSWEPPYGICTLVEAFATAYERDSRLRLILLNEGSEATRVRQFITTKRLARVVITPGIVAAGELPSWYRRARGYISCAISDGTSVSLLEAMATGLPAIVSDIPSNREWVVERQNGALAPVGSREDFAAKLLWVAGLDLSERNAIAERNQSVVAARADWDKNFPRLLNLYQLLVSASCQTDLSACSA